MNNDIFDTIKSNNQINQPSDSLAGEFGGLDALFSQTRAAEAGYMGGLSEDTSENFTKIVLNRLPSHVKRTHTRSILFDVIGLALGLIAAYWLFDITQLVQSLLLWVPESISITVANVASIFGAAIGVVCLGWWTAEKAMT